MDVESSTNILKDDAISICGGRKKSLCGSRRKSNHKRKMSSCQAKRRSSRSKRRKTQMKSRIRQQKRQVSPPNISSNPIKRVRSILRKSRKRKSKRRRAKRVTFSTPLVQRKKQNPPLKRMDCR